METRFDAIALAAGGARGAYQAGALLSLAEHGLSFRAVAGSSIGSVNGAFLAQGDGSPGHVADLCAIWRSLPGADLIQPSARGLGEVAALFACATGTAVGGVLTRLAAGQVALLDPAPLARVLDRWLDYGAICRSPTTLVVALLPEVAPLLDVLTAPWRAPSYVEARRLGPAELRSALLAAVAIPVVFPSRLVRGRAHADAGIADPLPARVLYDRGARRIVSILLSDDTPQNRADFPEATLLQVRPSREIDAWWPSMLDFSRASIERLIDLGYQDTEDVLGEIAELAGALIELRERGDANVARAEALRERATLDNAQCASPSRSIPDISSTS